MTFSGSFETASTPAPGGTLVVIEGHGDKPVATADELISELVALASYTNQLYLQAHLIHLNVEGPIFLPIHEFLKEQYDAHIAQFDALSEFVRSMDYLMPMCAKGLQGAYKNFKHIKSYEAREMLTVYVKNLEAAGFMAKDVGVTAKKVQAPDIENYLAELVGMMFKAAWFLKATLRD